MIFTYGFLLARRDIGTLMFAMPRLYDDILI